MSKAIFTVAILLVCSFSAAQTTRPIADELKHRAVTARDQLQRAKDSAKSRVMDTNEYKEAAARLAAAERAQSATTTPEDRLEAGKETAAARQAVATLVMNGIYADPGVATAARTAAEAEAAAFAAAKEQEDIARDREKKVKQAMSPLDDFKVGTIGILPPLTIRQIVSQGDMIVHVDLQDDSNISLWIGGINTTGMVDGQPLKIERPMKITETKTYKTAIGGSRTVFVAEPYTP
jgi:hypothetical protein